MTAEAVLAGWTSRESLTNLTYLALIVLAGMYGLLYMAFRNHAHAFIILVNLPLALIGGVVAVKLGGGVLSVASLVGFFALFGIAVRNGVLLVSHMAQVILGGLLTSTFLNLMVVPVLFRRWGGDRNPALATGV